MATINKENIYIDIHQQNKEKNIALADYPVYHQKTKRQLKHRFSHYFKDLDDYYKSKNPKYINWDDEYKHNSHEAYIFFNNVEYNEFRY